MKVDFMIVGAQKCGTTTLFEILARHPSIVGSKPKEPHFFSTSRNWRKELPRYEKLFAAREGARLFEASTSYTFSPLRNVEVWNSIYEYNPAMKFIYLVRSPIDRIVSNYKHLYQRGYTNAPIETEVVKHRLYIDASRYYTQIRPYIERFGRERVLVLDFHDLNRNRPDTIRTIAGFIGVSADGFTDFEDVHANRSADSLKLHQRMVSSLLPVRAIRKIAPPVGRFLGRAYRRKLSARPQLPAPYQRMIINQLELDIRALETLMGKDLSHWRAVKQ